MVLSYNKYVNNKKKINVVSKIKQSAIPSIPKLLCNKIPKV
jgi:hypothetical protein